MGRFLPNKQRRFDLPKLSENRLRALQLTSLSVRFGGCFPESISTMLQNLRYLQMLTLNDCQIFSLANFPILPALIRLDLVFNAIKGEDLTYLTHSIHLQTLMLGANQVALTVHLQPLKCMRKLLQLDLINNPVSTTPGYRAIVFDMFSSLSILDTLDRGGKDAYANSTMLEAVARIPDSLFDKSVSPPPAPLPVHIPIHRKEAKKLSSALARKGSLGSISDKPAPLSSGPPAPPPSRGKYGKMAKVASGRSRASRAGLIFPVGRIRRSLKAIMTGQRISSASSVYFAAVLEYLTAELLEIAGMAAKSQSKKRIMPSMLRDCLKNDQEMKSLLKNVTMSVAE